MSSTEVSEAKILVIAKLDEAINAYVSSVSSSNASMARLHLSPLELQEKVYQALCELAACVEPRVELDMPSSSNGLSHDTEGENSKPVVEKFLADVFCAASIPSEGDGLTTVKMNQAIRLMAEKKPNSASKCDANSSKATNGYHVVYNQLIKVQSQMGLPRCDLSQFTLKLDDFIHKATRYVSNSDPINERKLFYNAIDAWPATYVFTDYKENELAYQTLQCKFLAAKTALCKKKALADIDRLESAIDEYESCNDEAENDFKEAMYCALCELSATLQVNIPKKESKITLSNFSLELMNRAQTYGLTEADISNFKGIMQSFNPALSAGFDFNSLNDAENKRQEEREVRLKAKKISAAPVDTPSASVKGGVLPSSDSSMSLTPEPLVSNRLNQAAKIKKTLNLNPSYDCKITQETAAGGFSFEMTSKSNPKETLSGKVIADGSGEVTANKEYWTVSASAGEKTPAEKFAHHLAVDLGWNVIDLPTTGSNALSETQRNDVIKALKVINADITITVGDKALPEVTPTKTASTEKGSSSVETVSPNVTASL